MKTPVFFRFLPLILVVCPATLAQETVAPGSAEKALLQRSIDFVSALPAFSADIDMRFELADQSGQAREGAFTAKLSIAGADKARFRVEMDDGSMELFYSPDSKFLYISEQNQYVDGKSFGERQRALTLMPSREFGPAQIMFSDFLHAEPSLLESLETASMVKSEGDGPDAPDHVRAAGGGVSVDFWIRRGEEPILEKLQLDLIEMARESNPDLAKVLVTYTFSNWNTTPEFAPDHFTFAKPDGATELDTTASRPADPLEGKPAPEIDLPLLGSDASLNLAAHKGKNVVILDFWASWCGPCRVGLPIIAEVARAFKDKNVVFYAVNVGETPEQAVAFLQQTGLQLQVAIDPERDAQQKYQANSIPKTVIIDKAGLVHEVHAGVSASLKEDLARTLTALTE